jgi:anaerobic magnesium-protoporphyrin IX monomethyl ester cyclase
VADIAAGNFSQARDQEIMDIILINPPHAITEKNMWRKIDRCLPPLGLASIAAFLENKDRKVEIIDVGAEGISLDALSRRLIMSQPVFVGITVTTVLFDQALAIAKACRKAIPAAKIIMGGVHPTIACEEVLANQEIDYVVRGEGEETCFELISRGRPENVAGLSFKSGGRTIHNPDRPFIQDINSLPIPAYHLLPIALYRPSTGNYKRLPAASIVSSRGCPGRCTFCFTDVMGKNLRYRSASRIIEEVKFLQKSYGIREISFYDDTFTANRKNLLEFCRLIRAEKLDITWSCMSRIDCVDPQIVKEMACAGCHQIGYGIESADKTILANINKAIDPEKVKEVIGFTKAAGLTARGMFMLGNPGETMETMRKTLKLAIDLDCDLAVFNIATPYPGTQMFKWADENGYLLTKDWSKYDLSRSVMRLPTVSLESVNEFYRYAYRKFYMRPRYIFKRLLRLSSPRELMAAVGFFTAMLKERFLDKKGR